MTHFKISGRTWGARMHEHEHDSGVCYWLTGLPGAGKTTIAHRTAVELRARGHRVFILDGDELRRGLNNNLGFSRADRAENVRRIGEVARLMANAGLTVFVSAISPYRADRDAAMEVVGRHRCFEVFIDADLQVCVARDPKGLYARAKSGELKGLTGWDDEYERPLAPEISIHTENISIDESVLQVISHFDALQNKA